MDVLLLVFTVVGVALLGLVVGMGDLRCRSRQIRKL